MPRNEDFIRTGLKELVSLSFKQCCQTHHLLRDVSQDLQKASLSFNEFLIVVSNIRSKDPDGELMLAVFR